MLNNRTIQFVLAVVPLAILFVGIGGYFIFLFSVIGNMENTADGEMPTEFIGGMVAFMVAIILASILSLLSLIYYIIHATKNPNLKKDENNTAMIVWIVLFVLANGLGQLIYYIVEIALKKPKPVIE